MENKIIKEVLLTRLKYWIKKYYAENKKTKKLIIELLIEEIYTIAQKYYKEKLINNVSYDRIKQLMNYKKDIK